MLEGSSGGRAWVFGDDIDTDVLAPGLYMKGPVEELAKHCLESVDPAFAQGVAAGDIVVGGYNFGLGSSREQAAQVLKMLGVKAVVAKSFSGLFYRNALNLGLIAVVCPAIGSVKSDDILSVDARAACIENHTQGERYDCEPLPDHLMSMIENGGLIAHLELGLAAKRKNEGTI